MTEQMNEHKCEKCEHEKECLNMVCFYELLEKEEGKIRADEREKVLEKVRDLTFREVNYSDSLNDREEFRELLAELY